MVFTCAYAIVFPKKIALRIKRLIDVRLVRSYATKADWWRSLLFIITSHFWFFFIFIVVIFDQTN